jgi:nucleotide-binding universal stress UspA family protein
MEIRTILQPTDFSKHSQNALDLASSLARDHKARLLVLHVYHPPVKGAEVTTGLHPEKYQDHLWNKLQRLRPSTPDVNVEHLLIQGKPGAEIIRAGKDNHCDLIVMGTHGRTLLTRALVGSVAEHVMRQASCPVLTLKI